MPTVEAGPATVRTKEDFARELTALRERAGLSTRDLARSTGIPLATVGGYLSGRHLPQASSQEALSRLLAACGVTDDAEVKAWLDAASRARRTPGPRATGAPAPYRGLASFDIDDAAWFFGRGDLVERLVELVRDGSTASPIVVIGPSGSGKSSLLKAGLVPALADAEAVATGPEPSGATGAVWRTSVITPGDRPLERLAEAAAPWCGRDAAALAQAWRTGETPSLRADGAGSRLLVVDQFEELFAEDAATVRTVVQVLMSLAETGFCQVVLAVRSDFFTQLSGLPELVDAVQSRQVVVGPMTMAQLRDVVVEPALRAQVDVDPALVEVVLRDMRVRGATLSAAGALPLLSHALLSTWERSAGRRLTVADYQAAGGIEGALAASAEQAYGALESDARAAARRLLLGLIRLVDGVPVARRGLARSAVVSDDEGGNAESRALDGLIDARLLTAADGEVEIAHEALLWGWPRMRAWLEEDRDALRTHALLQDAAEVWVEHGRDEGLLHRGAPLAALLAWARDGGSSTRLARAESEFLDASVALAEAEQRRERRRSGQLRRLSSLLAVLLLATVALAAVSVEQTREATDLRERAVSRQLASSAERLSGIDASLAGQLALAGYRSAPTPEALAGLLSASSSPHAVRLLAGGAVQQAAATSADGELLAAVGADHVVRVWRLEAGGPQPAGDPVPAGDQTLFAVAFSPSQPVLVAGGQDGAVQRWRVGPRGALTALPSLPGPGGTVYGLTFGPDGTLAVAASEGSVAIWPSAAVEGGGTPQAGNAVAMPVSTEAVQAVAFAPDGRRLAAGGVDGRVRLFDLAPGQSPRALETTLGGAEGTVLGLSFSPDGSELFASNGDFNVYRYGVAPPGSEPLARFEEPGGYANGVAVSPDGRTVAGASSDNQVWLWDADTGAGLGSLPHPGPVTAVHWQGDARLITAGTDGAVRVWEFPTPGLGGAQASIFFAAFSPDGRWLGTAGSDALRLRSVHDGAVTAHPAAVVASPDGFGKLSGAGAFAPDGRWAALGGADGAVHLVDLSAAPPAVRGSLTDSEELIESVAFSRDGRLLAAGGDDNQVRLYDLADPTAPRLVATLTGPTSYVYYVAFAPDSRTLAVASVDATVRLFDVADPSEPKLIGEPIDDATSYVYAVAFSPDGRTLAAASDDKRLRLYDVSDLARPRLRGDPVPANSLFVSVAFAPDGRTVAAGTGDGGVLLVGLGEGDPVLRATLPAADSASYAVGFSPDGRTLVTAGAARTARLWTLDPAQAAESLCAGGGEPITRPEWRRFVPDMAYRPPCARS